jgi:hypothetical protein
MISNPVFLLLAASLPGHAPAHKLQARGEESGAGWLQHASAIFSASRVSSSRHPQVMAEYAMNQSKDADAHVIETILNSTKSIVLRDFLFIMIYPSDFSLDILCCTEGLSVIPVGQ